MPFNGSGTFTPLAPPVFPAVAGTPITAGYFNQQILDIINQGLSLVLVRDGQSTMTGDLDMGNNQINNVADPSSAQDAATKAYADLMLPLTGGNVTGDLNVAGKLGVGTTSPAYKVEVTFSTAGFDGLRLVNSSNSASAVNFLQFGNDANVAAAEIGLNSSTNSGNMGGVNALVVRNRLSGPVVFGTGNIERARISATGQFGVGVASPEAQLDVLDSIIARCDASGYAFFAPKRGTTPFGSNYDRFEIVVDTASQVTKISNARGGTGLPRAMAFLTDNIERLRISETGIVTYGGLEVGYRDLPIAGSLTRGQCFPITSGLTVDTSNAGELYTVYNDTGGNLTITQGAGLTMRWAGTTSTGNRTLLPRGFMNIWYRSATECIVSGNLS